MLEFGFDFVYLFDHKVRKFWLRGVHDTPHIVNQHFMLQIFSFMIKVSPLKGFLLIVFLKATKGKQNFRFWLPGVQFDSTVWCTPRCDSHRGWVQIIKNRGKKSCDTLPLNNGREDASRYPLLLSTSSWKYIFGVWGKKSCNKRKILQRLETIPGKKEMFFSLSREKGIFPLHSPPHVASLDAEISHMHSVFVNERKKRKKIIARWRFVVWRSKPLPL